MQKIRTRVSSGSAFASILMQNEDKASQYKEVVMLMEILDKIIEIDPTFYSIISLNQHVEMKTFNPTLFKACADFFKEYGEIFNECQ